MDRKKEAQFQIKGISQDLAYQLFNPQYAFEMKNIRINTTDENSLLSLNNEKGNKKLKQLVEGVDVLNVLGTGKFNDYCIIFATGYKEEVKVDYILVVDKEENIHILYEDDLNFDSNHPIKTICIYENEEIQKVYWIDGKNPPRVANVAPSVWYGNKSISEFQKLDFLPDIEFDDGIKITLTTGGKFPAGVIQYAYTYSDKNLQETNIVGISPLYYITQSSKGASAEDICNIAFKIEINNADTRFNYVQLYAIIRTSVNATPLVYRISDIPCVNNISYIDNGSRWELYSFEELATKQLNSFIPQIMVSKDSTLFMGNYTLESKAAREKDLQSLIDSIRESLNVLYENTNVSDNDYSFNLRKGSNSIKTFRNKEWYRIGIQFQDKKGTPSNVLYLKDINTEIADNYEDSSFKRKLLTAVIKNVNNTDFVRARLVMVDRTGLPKSTICQGVLCPTVYRVKDRVNNLPFAMSSWNMRFFNTSSLYTDWDNPPSESNPQWMTDMPIMPNTVLRGSEIINQTTSVKGVSFKDDTIKSSILVDIKTENPTGYYWIADVHLENEVAGGIAGNYPVYLKLGRTANATITHVSDCEDKFYTGRGIKVGNIKSAAEGIAAQLGYDITTNSGLKSYLRYLLAYDYLPKNGCSYPEIVADKLLGTWKSTDWNTYFNDPDKYYLTVYLLGTDNSEDAVASDASYQNFEEAIKVFNDIPYFFCDHNIVTFHSPDIEDNQALIDNNSNIKYRIVGYTQLNKSIFSDYLLMDLGAKDKSESAGEQIVERNKLGGIYSTPLWKDGNDTFMTYLWHKSMSLGDADEPDENGRLYGSYNRKVFANIHICSNSYALVNSLNDIYSIDGEDNIFPKMGTPRVFNSNEVSALTLDRQPNSPCLHNKLIYYGNVNMAHTTGSTKIPVFKNDKIELLSKTSTDAALIRYKSTPHVVIPLSYYYDNYYENGEWKRIPNAPSLPLPTGRKSIEGFSGTLTIPFDTYGYAWNTSVHSFSRRPLDLKNNGEVTENVIYIAELYQDLSIEEIYGDTTEENLSKYKWVPIGEWVELKENNILKGYGDTFIGRWDCLKTYSFTEEDAQSCVDVTSFIVESDINLESRYDNYKGIQDATMINPTNFNLYNPVYNQKDNLFQYEYLKESELLQNFQNQVCWSEVKTLGEELDTWSHINVGNNIDFNGEYGVLTAGINLYNNLYFFQNNAIYKLNYNTRVSISPSDGVPIQLSNNSKVEIPLLLKQYCGTNNQDKVTNSSNLIYFYDDNRKRIFTLTSDDKVLDLSSDKGINSIINKFGSIRKLYYDSIIKDMYFNFDNTSLAFNEDLSEFTSLYDYNKISSLFILDNNVYVTKDNYLYKQREGDYNYFFDNFCPFYIELLTNQDALNDKIFSNIEYTMVGNNDKEMSENIVLDSFNKLEVKNSYQEGSSILTPFRLFPSNLKRKFRIWRAEIPRDNSNKLNRMRDLWLKSKLIKDDINKNSYRINNINVIYYLT